jgi:hypothetical protein
MFLHGLPWHYLLHQVSLFLMSTAICSSLSVPRGTCRLERPRSGRERLSRGVRAFCKNPLPPPRPRPNIPPPTNPNDQQSRFPASQSSLPSPAATLSPCSPPRHRLSLSSHSLLPLRLLPLLFARHGTSPLSTAAAPLSPHRLLQQDPDLTQGWWHHHTCTGGFGVRHGGAGLDLLLHTPPPCRRHKLRLQFGRHCCAVRPGCGTVSSRCLGGHDSPTRAQHGLRHGAAGR